MNHAICEKNSDKSFDLMAHKTQIAVIHETHERYR